MLRFEAETFVDLFDWQNTEITEPPVTKNINTSDIRNVIVKGDKPETLIPEFPCHTQTQNV